MRATWVFAVASLAAVAAGCVAMSLSGVPAGAWIRNPVAWLVGAAGAALLCRTKRGRTLDLTLIAVAVLGIGATLLAAGQAGVHRWLEVGPLRINAAALLLPLAVVALARLRIESWLGATATLVVAALLALQPDASQMLGLALAVAAMLWSIPLSLAARLGGTAIAASVAVATWLRPDPLSPVDEVERIVAVAWNVAPLLALAGIAALAAASLSPLLAHRQPASLALAGYFGGVALAPLAGWFPVPLMGLSLSVVVGHWLAIGTLAAETRT